MWPFSKMKSNSEIHPLIEQFSALMENSKCLEWFENVAGGWNMGLPLDVAFDVQEAINLSYTITSMAGVSSTTLVDAAKSGDYTAINSKLHRSSSALNERAVILHATITLDGGHCHSAGKPQDGDHRSHARRLPIVKRCGPPEQDADKRRTGNAPTESFPSPGGIDFRCNHVPAQELAPEILHHFTQLRNKKKIEKQARRVAVFPRGGVPFGIILD